MKTYQQLTEAIMNGKGDGSGDREAGAAKSAPTPLPRLCRFYFHSGHCRAGDGCRFSHDARGMSREEALKTIPCPYFASGACRYGEYCELRHEEAAKQSAEAICGICLENVRPQRQFGLLSCCNHTFCHSCVMEWRTEGSSEVTSRRVCPTCRKPSDYVVPSKVLPANDEEKEQILQTYRTNLSTIPCKNFEAGQLGSCPFGRDCFYAHLDRKGKDIKARDKSMQQLYDERRDHRMEQDVDYIAEMILMMGLQRHFNGGRGTGRRNRRGRGRRGEVDDFVDIFLSDLMGTLLMESEDESLD